jgi:hypothetical protein
MLIAAGHRRGPTSGTSQGGGRRPCDLPEDLSQCFLVVEQLLGGGAVAQRRGVCVGSARRAGRGRPSHCGSRMTGDRVLRYGELVAHDEQLDVLVRGARIGSCSRRADRPTSTTTRCSVTGRRSAAEQGEPVEEPGEDQVEQAKRHVRDHAWWLEKADHRRSRAQADFWNPTGLLITPTCRLQAASLGTRSTSPARPS